VIVAGIGLVMLAGLAYLFYTNVLADYLARGGTETPAPALTQSPTAPAEQGKGALTPPSSNVSKLESPARPSGSQPRELGNEVEVADLKKPDKPEPPPVLPPSVSKPEPEKPPAPPTIEVTIPAPSAVAGVDAARIDSAIAKGVRYLKQQQQPDGTFDPGRPMAYAALCGLTLLECKVRADDPSVTKAAQLVRRMIADSTVTYDLSTAVLFLDRLGDPRDRPLIHAAALRIIAGQDTWGGWSYHCEALSPAATQEMHALLKAKRPKVLPAPPAKALEPNASGPSAMGELAWNRWGGRIRVYPGDNSNTQFALLALWVARRHDVAAGLPLVCSYRRYQVTQNQDGGWAYHATNQNSTNTMTCAGLLGLAIGRGAVPGAGGKDKLEDPSIQRALQALGEHIGTPVKDGESPPPMQNLYFLWSVERVAMLYDLKTVGSKDWYGWGAQTLLANQQPDGHWTGTNYNGRTDLADTCFALLFLNRSNLVSDLTENLRLHMVIRDPGAK
jgi:hypothetical protein